MIIQVNMRTAERLFSQKKRVYIDAAGTWLMFGTTNPPPGTHPYDYKRIWGAYREDCCSIVKLFYIDTAKKKALGPRK